MSDKGKCWYDLIFECYLQSRVTRRGNEKQPVGSQRLQHKASEVRCQAGSEL